MKSKAAKKNQAKPKKSAWAIVLPLWILLAALAIRVVSITSFGALFDERITSDVVTGIWHGELSNNWKYTVSAPEYRIDMYNFSSYMYADALFVGAANGVAATVSKKKSDPVTWSRLFSALLGTAAVYLIYLIARRLFGRATASIAMLLTAAIPLLVQDSHYARPETFVTALTLAAFLYLLKFDTEPGRLRYLGIAAFCFGLSIACKVSMLPMALMPLAFLAPAKNRMRLLPALAMCGGFTILGVFLGVPHAFFHPAAYRNGVEFLRKEYSGVLAPHGLADGGIVVPLMARYLWETTGPLFCLFSVAGIWILVRQRRLLAAALLAGPVLFYVPYFSWQHVFFERNISHVVPAMALLSAVALSALAAKIPARARTASLAGLVLLTVAIPARVSGKLVFAAMRPDDGTVVRNYETEVGMSVQRGIASETPLFAESLVDPLVHAAQGADSDSLIRVIDFHDSFTRKYLNELEQRSQAREVGYFPAVFGGFGNSTLVAYHSPSLRYILIQPSPPDPQSGFVPWSRAAQPITPGSVHLTSWLETSIAPGFSLPNTNNRWYSSYNAWSAGNTGEMELGAVPVRGMDEIGIPFLTGQVNTRQSLLVRNRRTQEPIVSLAPPVAPGWRLLRVDLSGQHPDEIDIVARDEGAGLGEWLAIGTPVGLKPFR